MTRIIAVLAIVALFSAALAGCSSVDAVAKVNGKAITQEEFDKLYAQATEQMGGEIPESQQALFKQQVLAWLIEAELITQEAERLDADLSDTAVKARVDELKGTMDDATFEEQLTAAGLTIDELNASVRDQLAREFVSAKAAEESSGTVELPEDYALLSHILVDGETTATAVYDRLKAGEDFAAVATAESQDPGSAANGGSLGWAPISNYVTQFADAARDLAVGELGTPVQSDFGWHIILKVAEAKAGTLLTDAPEELQLSVESSGSDLALQAYIQKLRDAAKIEYLDETLKPAEDSTTK